MGHEPVARARGQHVVDGPVVQVHGLTGEHRVQHVPPVHWVGVEQQAWGLNGAPAPKDGVRKEQLWLTQRSRQQVLSGLAAALGEHHERSQKGAVLENGVDLLHEREYHGLAAQRRDAPVTGVAGGAARSYAHVVPHA
ncbi:hypothetical protein AMR77_25625 [Escherichia coli]|nr:hypothetical protein AMR77_25625 [Escherichia coli]